MSDGVSRMPLVSDPRDEREPPSLLMTALVACLVLEQALFLAWLALGELSVALSLAEHLEIDLVPREPE